ncbi:MAG: PCMD domain-containing protein [Prevotellaceae bacterium]|jgi:hypothetical protein|nr:PCMD domain-containing protein [Prevotellaceae bacterium]
MKHILPLSYLVTIPLLFGFSSCKKDPPASIEADILTFSVPDSMQLAPVKVGTTFVNAFVRNATSSVVSMAPQITISAGARITPASGEMVQFTRSKDNTTMYEAHYQVESENRQNTKSYKVTLISPVTQPQYHFSFDAWDDIVINNGQAVYQTPSDRMWATGNPAVAIYISGKDNPSSYPASSTTTAVVGRAALLKTVAGAPQFGAPIAAGNLFWGIFNSGNLAADKLTFTQFGQPFYQKPKTLTGYYQYKPGITFTDKNNQEVAGRVDSCFIYGIFYETDENDLTLDGLNIQTSGRIVAKALLSNCAATTPENTFVPFSLDFVYTSEPDFINKLYKLTVVFTSSKGGAEFEGAKGSALIVDEVTLDCSDD